MPTENSAVYTMPLGVWSTTSVRAIAVAPGHDPSNVAVAPYTINGYGNETSPVSFAPSSGTYDGGVSVALSSATSPIAICFTLDGTAPGCNPVVKLQSPTCEASTSPTLSCKAPSLPYDAGASVRLVAPADGGTLTVRAVACSVEGASDITQATYTFPAP